MLVQNASEGATMTELANHQNSSGIGDVHRVTSVWFYGDN